MSFVRPSLAIDGDERPDSTALNMLYNPHAEVSLTAQRERLPIAQVRLALLAALEQHDSLVLVGATGCGKSTATVWLGMSLHCCLSRVA
jgi:HrpA-like RNA helicase